MKMKRSFIIPCLFFIFCAYSCTQGEMTCVYPYGDHVENTPIFDWDSHVGKSKSYRCETGYQATAERAVCTENGWSPKPLCTEIKCTVPTFENAKRLEKIGAALEYQCNPGHEPERFVITCNQQGDWDYTSHCTSRDCGPPPLIRDAVQDLKERYKNGEIATYECPAYYIKNGDPHMTCRNGKWIGEGQCLQPCTVDVYQMDPRHIQLHRGDMSKMYAKHGEYLMFRCQRGYEHDGEMSLRQQCLDGKIDLPLCV